MNRYPHSPIRTFLGIALCVVVAAALTGCTSCHPNSTPTTDPSAGAASAYNDDANFERAYADRMPPTPTYEDPRWPTRNEELLAIPEYCRWYNAWASAETTCTIAGPVVNVYQATESNGMPIFVDIGTAYPDDNSVSLVIWADQYYDFEQMLDDVSAGGAWISVTGYLSIYNGRLQFDAGDGYVEYTWWTNVS